MLNFDRNNQEHILLVVGILKYISEDKCVKCFKQRGQGMFNPNAFNKKISNTSTHNLVEFFKDIRDGRFKNLTTNNKERIEVYIDKATFEVTDTVYSYTNRLYLESAYSEIKDNQLLPFGLAEQVWKKIFSKTDNAMKTPVLPENVLRAYVCKDLELKSSGLVTSVITGSLQWAYDHSTEIINAAKNNGCQFRYIITSNLASSNLKHFQSKVKENDVSDKIKFAKIEKLRIKVTTQVLSKIS